MSVACKYFAQGNCKYGDNCKYSHASVDEVAKSFGNMHFSKHTKYINQTYGHVDDFKDSIICIKNSHNLGSLPYINTNSLTQCLKTLRDVAEVAKKSSNYLERRAGKSLWKKVVGFGHAYPFNTKGCQHPVVVDKEFLDEVVDLLREIASNYPSEDD